MNNPLQTLLELRAYLAERAEYYLDDHTGRLMPNAAQELLLKLDQLIDQAKADRELEQREAILDQRVGPVTQRGASQRLYRG